MATGITTYQCPACTGPLHFVGESGKLECDYCDSTYTVEEIEKLYAQKEHVAVQAQSTKERRESEQAEKDREFGSSWSEQEARGLKVYHCSSCGAELICDVTTAATSCPYCGNPTIIPSQFAGGLRPDLIIPFKLDKEAAKAALKNFYRGKKFLPKAFADENHIEEIKGVYVPFWLYDWQLEGTVEFAAQRTRSWRQGDYRITETDHFRVLRSGDAVFSKIPADGSTKMPDGHMDAIEPFDYTELTDFSTAYLPGFFADKYDAGQEENASRAQERARNSFEDLLRQSVQGYGLVTRISGNVDAVPKGVKYTLLPVWMLSTRWKGQNFLFAMNGQTGKLVGDLPVDKKKYWGWFAGIALPFMAIMLGFFFL